MAEPRPRAYPTAPALAALSGLLYWAAFPPVDVWPLAFVAWAPLLVAVQGQRARTAALLGGVQGFVAVAAGFSWLPSILKTFGDLPIAICTLFALVIYVYSAGRSALLAWLFVRAAQRGWSRTIALGLAFAASEVAYPLLFPWYTAAQAHRLPLLLQAAEIGGPIAVGLPLVVAGSLFAEIALARVARRPVNRLHAAAAITPLLLTSLFGFWRMPQIARAIESAPRVLVGLVQANLPHAGSSLSQAIALHRRATAGLASSAADLVVWPETALNGVVDVDGLEAKLRDEVIGATPRPYAPSILSGVMLRRGSAISNSAILFDGRGGLHGIYDKVHPLLIGERIPFGDRFPALYRWIPNAGSITPGEHPTPLVFGEHRISILICYEDLLPGYANDAVAEATPDLLVNLTNDSWFGASSASAAHFALSKLRAVEHRRYLVRAANSGISGFVDPLGRASGETALLTSATRVEELRWMASRTIYERLGDAPFWLAAAAIAIMAFVPRRAFRRTKREAAA